MPTITLRTIINSDKKIVFDLSRSIDLHKISTKKTKEQAIHGRTEGLIELNETVTWRAKHFGVYQKLTSKITAFKSPNYFVDEMITGIFHSFKHQHIFETENNRTVMIDVFEYKSPFGILGRFADKLFLEKYMTKFLKERNTTIKLFAESGKYVDLIK
jgi:ligand-binding SRPBCC domain-containing protein